MKALITKLCVGSISRCTADEQGNSHSMLEKGQIVLVVLETESHNKLAESTRGYSDSYLWEQNQILSAPCLVPSFRKDTKQGRNGWLQGGETLLLPRAHTCQLHEGIEVPG